MQIRQLEALQNMARGSQGSKVIFGTSSREDHHDKLTISTDELGRYGRCGFGNHDSTDCGLFVEHRRYCQCRSPQHGNECGHHQLDGAALGGKQDLRLIEMCIQVGRFVQLGRIKDRTRVYNAMCIRYSRSPSLPVRDLFHHSLLTAILL